MKIPGKLFIISLLLYSCSGKSGWESIKKTSSVYLPDKISTYSILAGTNPERRWVNEAYKNFAYKKYCSHLVEATFYLTDPKVRITLLNDSLSIAKMLQNDFKKEGVALFAGQTLTNTELQVYLYHEDGMNPIQRLLDFRIPNEGIVKDDPEWKEYKLLLLAKTTY
jgi:hypothetical protein